jgi:hypothetical protein
LDTHAKTSESGSGVIDLRQFLATRRGQPQDPAKRVCATFPLARPLFSAKPKDFERRLKNYILRWTSTLNSSITSYDQFTDADRSHVTIPSGTLHRHKTLQLQYTTYDMRRCEERLYQRLHPDVMVLSDDDEHPYIYGRIIDIFHMEVRNDALDSILQAMDSEPARLEVAWVRWFKLLAPDGSPGFHSLRHPPVAFYPGNDPDAFGFIHPDEIIRQVHMIPHFKHGQTQGDLGGSLSGRPENGTDDWKQYCINMYDAHYLCCVEAHPPIQTSRQGHVHEVSRRGGRPPIYAPL